MIWMNGKIKSGWLSRTPLGGRFIAVDFDSNQLRLAQVSPGISGPGLRKLRCVDIPADVDIKNPEQMGACLAKALRSEGFSRLPLVMTVPRSQAVLKPLHLPPGTERDEIAGMVKFQVQAELPFLPEETVLDFTIEGESQGGEESAGLEVLAAAVPTSTVEYYRNIASEAGYRLLRLGLRSYANACCAEACDALDPDRITALVHVTADETEIDILEGHSLAFSRAAAVKITRENLADPHARLESVDTVVSEIIRTLQGYIAQNPEGKVSRILIAGGTGIEAEAVDILSQVEKYNCTLFDPANAGKLRKKNLSDAATMISVIGLSQGSRNGQSLPFDFLHPKQPVIKRDPKLARRNALALAGMLVLIIFIAGSWLHLDGKASEVARLQQEKKSGEDNRKKLKRLINRVNEIDNWDEGRVDWLDQLANISSVIPDAKAIYIDDLKTITPSKTLTEETSAGKTVQRKPKGCLSLTVRAHDGEDIAKFVKKLQEAGYIPETQKDSEDLNNKHGYVRQAKMKIYIPADMEIDIASLKNNKKPPLEKADKSGEASR